MPARSGGRKFSFDLLAGDSSGDERSILPRLDSDPILSNGADGVRSPRRRRRPKASKKNKNKMAVDGAASEDLSVVTELGDVKPSVVENGRCQDGIGIRVLENRSVVETICENTVVEAACENSQVSRVSFAELRQRNVNGSAAEEPEEDATSTRERLAGQWKPESNGAVSKLAKEESLDWNRMMENDPNLIGVFPVAL
ncbi:hypothetical protein B296_00030846 [Ensete ventricosum]|uniref:Uncharacterized protein n=1 Tax=Ensete ventricosum TaxID=4639 RepID=A0A426ZBJ3_ENSVE|nr:hypothetical protein B296_00030846 [Ensete ventricosum]